MLAFSPCDLEKLRRVWHCCCSLGTRSAPAARSAMMWKPESTFGRCSSFADQDTTHVTFNLKTLHKGDASLHHAPHSTHHSSNPTALKDCINNICFLLASAESIEGSIGWDPCPCKAAPRNSRTLHFPLFRAFPSVFLLNHVEEYEMSIWPSCCNISFSQFFGEKDVLKKLR